MTLSSVKSDVEKSFGLFWLKYFYDKYFVKKKAESDNIILELLYNNFYLTENRLFRHKVPVYDTYKYKPIVIYKKFRNKAQNAIPEISNSTDIVIGGQSNKSKYGDGVILKIGEAAVPSGYVAYQSDFNGLVSAKNIVNNIFLPSNDQIVYANNKDFYIKDSVIFIKEEFDPFSNVSKFLIFGKGEQEYCLLWAETAAVESTAVKESLPMPYELINTNNSEYLKKSVNAFFDSAYKPVDHSYLVNAIELILGYSPVKIYIVESFATMRAYNNKTISEFKIDVPYIILSSTVFSDDIADFTVIFKNDDTELIYAGIDANSNRRYKFKFDATEEQQQFFWNGIWHRYEADNRDMTEDLSDYITHYPIVDNSVCGKINPVQFFIEKFNCGNNLICILEFDKIPEYIISIDVVNLISRLLPANILFIAVGLAKELTDEWNISAGDNAILNSYDELTEENILSMGDSIQCRVI